MCTFHSGHTLHITQYNISLTQKSVIPSPRYSQKNVKPSECIYNVSFPSPNSKSLLQASHVRRHHLLHLLHLLHLRDLALPSIGSIAAIAQISRWPRRPPRPWAASVALGALGTGKAWRSGGSRGRSGRRGLRCAAIYVRIVVFMMCIHGKKYIYIYICVCVLLLLLLLQLSLSLLFFNDCYY